MAKVDTQPESKVAKKIPAHLHRGIMLVDEKRTPNEVPEKMKSENMSPQQTVMTEESLVPLYTHVK